MEPPLPGFIAGCLRAAARQNASINRQDFDLIRSGNRLERCAGTALLPPRLAASFPYGLLPAIGIHRRRLALFLLLRPNRFTMSVTRSNSTSRLDLSAGDSSFSSAIRVLTRSIVAF